MGLNSNVARYAPKHMKTFPIYKDISLASTCTEGDNGGPDLEGDNGGAGYGEGQWGRRIWRGTIGVSDLEGDTGSAGYGERQWGRRIRRGTIGVLDL